MAEKGAYGGHPTAQGSAPPPYQQYPSGQAAPGTTVVLQSGAQTTVIQTSGRPVVVQQKPSRGLFGSVMKEVNLMGKQLGREIDYVGNKINQTVDTTRSAPLLSLFQTGNVVQLVSRSTGRALQILMGHNAQLVVDGNGPVDPNAYHAAWTVVQEGNNQVRLHNNHNYLTVSGGHTTLVPMAPGAMHGVETKWQLSINFEQTFVMLESLKERGRHIGILQNGQLKPALATGRDNDAHFGVQLVHSPYPQSSGTTVTTVTTVKK